MNESDEQPKGATKAPIHQQNGRAVQESGVEQCSARGRGQERAVKGVRPNEGELGGARHARVLSGQQFGAHHRDPGEGAVAARQPHIRPAARLDQHAAPLPNVRPALVHRAEAPHLAAPGGQPSADPRSAEGDPHRAQCERDAAGPVLHHRAAAHTAVDDERASERRVRHLHVSVDVEGNECARTARRRAKLPADRHQGAVRAPVRHVPGEFGDIPARQPEGAQSHVRARHRAAVPERENASDAADGRPAHGEAQLALEGDGTARRRVRVREADLRRGRPVGRMRWPRSPSHIHCREPGQHIRAAVPHTGRGPGQAAAAAAAARLDHLVAELGGDGDAAAHAEHPHAQPEQLHVRQQRCVAAGGGH